MSGQPIPIIPPPHNTSTEHLGRRKLAMKVRDTDGKVRQLIEVDSIQVGRMFPAQGKPGVSAVTLKLTDHATNCPMIMAFMMNPDQADDIADGLKRSAQAIRDEAAEQAAAALKKAGARRGADGEAQGEAK